MSATAEAIQEARRAALEAEASGNSVLPGEADPNGSSETGLPPGVDPSKVPTGPRKSSADLARDAIYARAIANRNAGADESTADMHAGVEAMLAEATGQPTGEPIAPGEQPVAKSVATPLANPQDTITVVVDGRAIAVPTAEVIRQGIATVQKETAADIRLQRVSQAEQAIAVQRAALDARAAEIERRATTQTGAAQPGASEHLPSGGQPRASATKEALDALLDSNVDGAAQKLDQVIADQVEAKLAARGQPLPTATPANTVAEPWSMQEKIHANRLFERAYPDVLRHPQAAQQAVARMQAEMESPVNRLGKVDLVELADRIGQEMRAAITPAPRPAPSVAFNSADELQARRTLAARVPGVPASSVARSVSPAPSGPAPKSRSDVVADMRKARGFA